VKRNLLLRTGAAAGVLVLGSGLLVAGASLGGDGARPALTPVTTAPGGVAAPPTTAVPTIAPTTTPPTTTAPPFAGWSDPAGVGQPYGDTVRGLLTFRGNPTRTYYGAGPVPRTAPVQAWRFPRTGGMCSESSDGRGARIWCGTGWTGQPSVFERDGRTWVVFGAYDRSVHFLDAATGERIIPSFPTGDLIKGSVTIDPDGYPIVYVGSRDNYLRAIAFDRAEPTELWRLSANAVSPTMWNNDWDGAPLVIDDYLFEGGENSQFHIVKLNRAYGPDGKVTVAPKLVFNTPGWDDQLLRDIGDREVSIENSVAVHGDVVYFANSGGLVQGWDISGLKEGRKPERVFRFWAGDDIDASIVIDEEGALYVGAEWERGNVRAKEVGQMFKLDPRRPDDPLVWKIDDRATMPAGVWGTPALHKDIVIFDTNGGDVLGVDRDTGAVRWKFRLPGPTWQSPVVVDDVLLIGDCNGVMHAYDVADTGTAPVKLWSVNLGGCIESTPAVWNGRIYVGTRAGGFHALALP
jgi:outer membrane protein assembly factor BamB